MSALITPTRQPLLHLCVPPALDISHIAVMKLALLVNTFLLLKYTINPTILLVFVLPSLQNPLWMNKW
jgi:hypothetical protein